MTTEENQEHEAAFETLVLENRDRVFRVVLSVLGPGRIPEAEDVTQEVFMKAYRKWSRFRGESASSTWLHRIAVNAAIDRSRLARIRKSHLNESVLDNLHAEDDPMTSLGEKEQRLIILNCLESTPPAYRSVLALYYWMEWPVREIAETLGIPSGTVKARLSRGRALVGRCLKKKGIEQ